MILSIIVISHNQKEQLRRCLESILAQELPFEHEIIVSDDRSTDGTRELIREYEGQYPGLIKGYWCNSDECNPAMVSERAGYNRINGLKHASGKYLIHVDGDDYYIDNTCFRKQVDALERHPECTICCQRFIWQEDDTDVNDSEKAFSPELFVTDRVLSVYDFVNEIPYIHNSACCLRRSERIDISNLRGCEYDDVDITYQYIENGKIVLIDSCGFVYSHHASDSASHFQTEGQTICWLTCVSSSVIAPNCAYALLRAGILDILHVINMGRKRVQLDDNIVAYLSKSKAFLFRAFDNKYRLKSQMRLSISWMWIHMIIRFHIDTPFAYKILYQLIIDYKVPDNVSFSRFKND